MTWWNVKYPFRRNLSIAAPVGGLEEGHPATIVLSMAITVDSGKLREDLMDLVVAYETDDATPIWLVVPRQAIQIGQYVNVSFPIQEDMAAGEVDDDSYFIYYGNPDLEATPLAIPYTADPWPVAVEFSDAGIAYTRPGEHWHLGISQETGAKATFEFSGEKIRLVSHSGPNWGIAEVQIDDNSWQEVDLFNVVDEFDVEVFSTTVEPGVHTFRVRDAGKHNPSAYSSHINVVSIDYLRDVTVVDLGEEIDQLDWESMIGGT